VETNQLKVIVNSEIKRYKIYRSESFKFCFPAQVLVTGAIISLGSLITYGADLGTLGKFVTGSLSVGAIVIVNARILANGDDTYSTEIRMLKQLRKELLAGVNRFENVSMENINDALKGYIYGQDNKPEKQDDQQKCATITK